FQAEDGIRDFHVTGVQTCALPIFQTRQLMENEVLELWSAKRKAVLFITHDLDEAIAMSDRVVVMSAGPASHLIGEFVIDLPRPRSEERRVGKECVSERLRDLYRQR